MHCKKCGNEVDGTPYCPYCGTKVEVRAFCIYCGKETKGTPFCPHCGKRQKGVQTGNFPQETEPKKANRPSLNKRNVFGIIVLCVLLLGIMVIRKEKDHEVQPTEQSPVMEAAPILPVRETFPEETETVDLAAETYAEAIKAYDCRDYYSAQLLFEEVSDYADSSKYLRLIRIRNAGTNIGVGSKVYQAECGLTESQKRDIDAAAADFYFADTAEVLVCNSDVASYYLIGEWNGGSKCYIHFIANNYGCRYNIGSKLSTNYQDTFAINDGIVTVDVVNTCAVTLKLTLLSPDCMEVYTYEKGGQTYTLNRS